MSEVCFIRMWDFCLKDSKNLGGISKAQMGLYFLYSVLLKSFVIGVNDSILVLVVAVEDWHLYLESLMLVFGRYYHQVRDLLQSRAELQKQEVCDFHK